MGFTMRTPSWRFTTWVAWSPALRPDWTKVNATELYAHDCDTPLCDNDFDRWDNENVAEEHASTVAALRPRLALRGCPFSGPAAPAGGAALRAAHPRFLRARRFAPQQLPCALLAAEREAGVEMAARWWVLRWMPPSR